MGRMQLPSFKYLRSLLIFSRAFILTLSSFDFKSLIVALNSLDFCFGLRLSSRIGSILFQIADCTFKAFQSFSWQFHDQNLPRARAELRAGFFYDDAALFVQK